jgi:hypothetical protein
MCRLPEPVSAIARRLQAEKPPVPVWVMDEANVLDRKIELLPLPFRRPGKVRIFEPLPEPRNLDRIRRREENLEAYGIAQHCPIHPAAYSSRK